MMNEKDYVFRKTSTIVPMDELTSNRFYDD